MFLNHKRCVMLSLFKTVNFLMNRIRLIESNMTSIFIVYLIVFFAFSHLLFNSDNNKNGYVDVLRAF